MEKLPLKGHFQSPADFIDALRPRWLQPDYEVRGTLADLDLRILEEHHIKGVIFDVDNVLCGYGGTAIDKRVERIFQEIVSAHATCLLSNTSPERRKLLQHHFRRPVVDCDILKPNPKPFQMALELLGTEAQETAMIGDRLLMDVVGAKKMGIYAVRVQPLGYQPLPLQLANLAETFLLRFYQE